MRPSDKKYNSSTS